MKQLIFGRDSTEVLEALKLYDYLKDAGMLEEITLKAKIAANKNYISKTAEDIVSMEKQLAEIQK